MNKAGNYFEGVRESNLRNRETTGRFWDALPFELAPRKDPLPSGFTLFLDSFFPKFLAPFLPVVALTLVKRTFSGAKLLSSAFDFEEFPTLIICADSDLARIEEFAPEKRIKQRPNSVSDTTVHLGEVGVDGRAKHVQQFANYDATI